MHFTTEQQRAIDTAGSNLLLSAAAGSGKTTVLVERIMRMIRDGSASLKNILVVTFTRASAADIRAKLSRKISEAVQAGEAVMRKEELLLDSALITTLHGFCAEFLHENFERAGIDPAFTVIDDSLAEQLLEDALDEILDEAYAQPDEEMDLADQGRGPKKLKELVHLLFERSEEQSDPEMWLDEMSAYSDEQIQGWLEELHRDAIYRIEDALAMMRSICEQNDCPDYYRKAIEKDMEKIKPILQLQSCDEILRALDGIGKFTTARAPKGAMVDDEAKERVKKLRDSAKKVLTDQIPLKKHTVAQGIRDIQAMRPVVHKLAELTRQLRQRYDEKKRDICRVTYADLEHLTLRVLRDSEDVQAEMRRRFAYIFIDEYQDTSRIQEDIISGITRGDNVFCVGDIKQSIYRFRNADPAMFTCKMRDYAAHEDGALLVLSRNFRSDGSILGFVNQVFSNLMTQENQPFTGGIVYDETQRLNPPEEGARAEDVPVEIHLIEEKNLPDEAHGETDSAIADLKSAELEAHFVARRIRELMDEDPTLHYRDIAILSRKKANLFSNVLPILLQSGIPAYADGASGFFQEPEVGWTICALKVLSNRHSDVELLNLLASPIPGLSAQELADVRILQPKGSLWEAVARVAYDPEEEGVAYATREKLRRFLDLLQTLRVQLGSYPLGTLVRKLLMQSGMMVYAGAMPGGERRLANLDRIIQKASRFERETSGSLQRFIFDLEHKRQKEDEEVANLLGENDDVVRVMTVHKSKGLEFKVVFGMGMGNKFSAGRTSALVADREMGFACKLYDPELRTRRETIAQTAITERARREDAAEEIRILYVLLTRAKTRLLLYGTFKNMEAEERNWDVCAKRLTRAKSHMALVKSALLRAKEAGEMVLAETHLHDRSELSVEAEENVSALDALSEVLEAPESYTDPALEEALDWKYPDADRQYKPMKLSVSGLMRELEGPQSLPELQPRPRFLQEQKSEGGLNRAERGTATHKVLQLLDLDALEDRKGTALVGAVRSQMHNMRERELLTDAQAEAVSTGCIARFLESEMGLRMRAAQELHREWAFNALLRVGEVLTREEAQQFDRDELIVQGSIDCCFLEDGAWVLLDYKTDRLPDDEALRSRYRKQIEIYALALEKITGIPVKERVLCLIVQGKTITI